MGGNLLGLTKGPARSASAGSWRAAASCLLSRSPISEASLGGSARPLIGRCALPCECKPNANQETNQLYQQIRVTTGFTQLGALETRVRAPPTRARPNPIFLRIVTNGDRYLWAHALVVGNSIEFRLVQLNRVSDPTRRSLKRFA